MAKSTKNFNRILYLQKNSDDCFSDTLHLISGKDFGHCDET